MRKPFQILIVSLTLATFLGCASEQPVEPPGELTIYSGRSETLVGPLLKQFSNATGIKTSVKYAGTPQLAATLLEEDSNSPADIFLAQDPGGIAAVEDLLAPLPAAILDLVPAWASSATGNWVGLSGRARVVVYNTRSLTESDLPPDIFEFIDPQWEGRIGWAPTNASFQTMVTAMRSIWGEEKTRRWLRGIQANDPKIYPKNTPIVAAVGSGEVDVGFVNHYYLHRFLAEEGQSFPARNYHPKSAGPGAIIMVAGAGILKQSSNRAAAERFLRFMLSPVSQEYFASETFEYPLAEGAAPHPGLVPLLEIPNPGLTAQNFTDLKGTQELLRETGLLP